jgi:hypothetical protein
MCHLCRKLEALKELDSKAIKPILVLLSRLHKTIEPRLGDLWLWRYDQAIKLRTLISALHVAMPVTPLKDMLNHVDRELYHIRKNMPDHPPRRSTGRLETLKTSIAVSSSASHHATRETQREGVQKKGDYEEENRHKDLIDLPGSDIDPPQERIQQSVRIVEDWFKRCNEVSDTQHSVQHKDDWNLTNVELKKRESVQSSPDNGQPSICLGSTLEPHPSRNPIESPRSRTSLASRWTHRSTCSSPHIPELPIAIGRPPSPGAPKLRREH